MSNLNQLILSFDHEQNFKNLDFYVSKSNAHVFNLINSWQMVNEKFLNIIGEKFCGKTHLINIFLEIEKKDPRNEKVFFYLGLIYFELNDYKKCIFNFF